MQPVQNPRNPSNCSQSEDEGDATDEETREEQIARLQKWIRETRRRHPRKHRTIIKGRCKGHLVNVHTGRGLEIPT